MLDEPQLLSSSLTHTQFSLRTIEVTNRKQINLMYEEMLSCHRSTKSHTASSDLLYTPSTTNTLASDFS